MATATFERDDPGTATGSTAAAVVLVVRDEAVLTLRTLMSLAGTADERDFHTVLVDDSSTDRTATLTQSVSGDFTALREDRPRGFAAGCDRAIAACEQPFLVILREDLVVCDGWLSSLLAPFTDPSVGAVHPRVVDIAGRELTGSSWPCLAVRRTAHSAVGGLQGASCAGRPVKPTFTAALQEAGWRIATAPGALLLSVPEAASEAASMLEI